MRCFPAVLIAGARVNTSALIWGLYVLMLHAKPIESIQMSSRDKDKDFMMVDPVLFSRVLGDRKILHCRVLAHEKL